MPHARTWPSLISLFIVVSILVFSNCSRGESGNGGEGAPAGGSAPATEPIAVNAVSVTPGRLIDSIESSGTLSGTREATIVAEARGVIEAVAFDLGTQVEAGTTLVQVDDEIPRLNMEQARQELRSAQLDYRSKENLLERGGSSRAEVLRAESSLSGAEARYQQAKKSFEDCSISSPIAGYVAERAKDISVGNYLSQGSPVARIVDISSLRLEVTVGESIIGLVEEGANARVRVPAACEGREFQAKVTAVAAGSDPATGSYIVVVRWKNECGPKIKSGMSAEVTIEPRELEPRLIIPSAAVTSRGGREVVFIVKSEGNAGETPEDAKSTVEERPVQLGRRLGNRTIVESGVQEGEKVILTGISGLSEGDPVRATVIGESGSRQ